MSGHEQSMRRAAQKTARRRRVAVFLAFVIALLLAAYGRPCWHLGLAVWNDADERETLPAGFADDASRLNKTHVAEVIPVEKDALAAERQLTDLLRQAREKRLRVSIAGARHTMGGHTIAPGGIVVNMLPFNSMELDEERNVLHVQAGARWCEILPYLEARGRSVAVMQSDNTFSVGGSLSANCHGWQFNRPPIASTVESFRIMLADGQILPCSRAENSELFSLALGGYGLFGIILDADLRVVPNERYRLEQFVVPLDKALETFVTKADSHPDVAMVYARMNIVPTHFLDNVILNVMYRDPAPDGIVPALAEPPNVMLRRALFRGSAGSPYGKQLRWTAETEWQPLICGRHCSRNQLLNEGSDIFADRSANSTDIIQEYFIPRGNIDEFVEELRRIVPRHHCDLLNITVRSINTDNDSFLRYAREPVFSLALLFNQPRTPAGEVQMEGLTRQLIDAALASGGRFYLPYRLHATREQFARAYPQAAEFFKRKRVFDPQGIFQNRFSLKYGDNPH